MLHFFKILHEICFIKSSQIMTESFIRDLCAAPVPRVFSGVTRGLSQAENLTEKGPLANTQKYCESGCGYSVLKP